MSARIIPFPNLSTAGRSAVASVTAAPVNSPQPAGAVVTTSSLAKEPEANACSAKGGRRRVRVGESGAGLTATSELMDVTAGETAPNSRDGASELLGGVAGACSGIKCGENRTRTEIATSGDSLERQAINFQSSACEGNGSNAVGSKTTDGSARTSSGDGLGNHEPGSMTWGGDLLATAPSGRADVSAECPAVAGSLSCGSLGSLPSTPFGVVQLRAASLDMPGPQELNSVVADFHRGAPALRSVSSVTSAAPSGVAAFSEADLEAAWLLMPGARDLPAMFNMAMASRTLAAKASVSNSSSLFKL